MLYILLTHHNESGRLIIMAKRLQVILQDPEYLEIQKMARGRSMSLAEWVRQALDVARRREPLGNTSKKLDVVRAAVQHNFPTADIDTMLAEIERGYVSDSQP
jgi:hypothetical protein